MIERTFRDPAGSLEIHPNEVLRYVSPAYAAETRRLLNHPAVAKLSEEGRLIPSEIVRAEDGGEMVLRHPRVPFIAYPWEWPPALWFAAADLTLDLALELLPQGWTLKDATPLNVLFRGVRPVLVDVLSIEAVDLTRTVWLPYGQFVRTFLLPMIAYGRLGWPLAATQMRRDGYEPEELYEALTWDKRLSRPNLLAVTLPVVLGRAQRQPATENALGKASSPELARHVLGRTFRKLRRQMQHALPRGRVSAWSHYAESLDHYSEADMQAKESFVREALLRGGAKRVLDVGCNTGAFSRLAAETGAAVVAIDGDVQAVQRLALSLQGSGLDILPLCVDIAQPTPATGWKNREHASFLSRCEGHFDAVLMLAVLHHLLLGSQIPLERIAALCGTLTTRHLILEWVPPADPKFQQVLRGRGAIYAHITEEAFRGAFAEHFEIAAERKLENGRTLFHFVREHA